MQLRTIFLLLTCCLASANLFAADKPAKGKLLVSTELVGGPAFQETVILLLRYNDAGTLGLVINRRTEATPDEVLPEMEAVRQYDGTLYFGGPVQLHTVRGLLRTDDPPDDAIPIFGNVYVAALDDAIFANYEDDSSLRLYIGYAGWAPGQLEQELAEGSWWVIDANEWIVFSDEPEKIWQRVKPGDTFRVSL